MLFAGGMLPASFETDLSSWGKDEFGLGEMAEKRTEKTSFWGGDSGGASLQ